MTTGGEDALEQLTKCLDFCQALASKGHHFNLNLTLGNSITISLETKESQPTRLEEKKRKSRSTLKRNLKRKEEFLRKKCSETTVTKEQSEEETSLQKKSFDCDQCEQVFSTDQGLKIHTGKTHKREALRSASPVPLPKVSPGKESPREGHHGDQALPCTKCTQTFNTKHQLNNHWGDGIKVATFIECQGKPPPRNQAGLTR